MKGATVVPSGGLTASVQQTRAASFLLLLSMVLVLEGVSRSNLYIGTPSGEWTGNETTFPPVVLLIAALGILFYGLLGVVVGFTALVYGKGSSTFTFVCLAIEFPLGWYFFTCNVLAAYPFMVSRATAPLPGLNGMQSNAVIMMGYIGSMGLGIPLLGGHFFFVLQLAQILRGHGSMYTHTYYRARVYFYGFLMTLYGIAQVSIGGILRSAVGPQRYLPPYASLPFVVSYSQIDIAVGCLVIVLGLASLVIAGANLVSLSPGFSAASFVVLIVQLALSDMTQIGLLSAVPGAPTIVGAIVSWNLITMTLMPAYLISSMDETVVSLDHGAAVDDGTP